MESITKAAQTAWWVFLVRGLLGIALGFLALWWPGATLAALVILLATFFVLDGVLTAMKAVQMRSMVKVWWVLLLSGIASVVIGVVSVMWPSITLLALVYLVAFWAVITGVAEVAAAWRLRMSMGNDLLYLIFGMISIIFGFFAAAVPPIGLTYLVLIISLYGFVTGTMLIGIALRLREVSSVLK